MTKLMFSTQRIRRVRQILLPPSLNWRWDLAVAVLLFVWVGFGSGWNGKTMQMWGRSVPGYPVDRGEGFSAAFLLRDVLSTYFLIQVIPLFTRLLLPLARSFSINQTLWLRMTSALALETRLARCLASIQGISVFFVPMLLMVVLVRVKHPVLWPELWPILSGIFAYTVFASGFVHAVSPFGSGESMNASLIAVAGAALPFLSYSLYETVLFNFGYHWARYYPTFFPFIPDLRVSNSLSVGVAGGCLHLFATIRYSR